MKQNDEYVRVFKLTNLNREDLAKEVFLNYFFGFLPSIVAFVNALL